MEEEDPLINTSQSSKGEEGGSVDIKEECVEEVDPQSSSPLSIEGTRNPIINEN